MRKAKREEHVLAANEKNEVIYIYIKSKVCAIRVCVFVSMQRWCFL
jgi:hypothetical protein